MDIASMIVAEASAQGVNPNLALAVARQESGLNPNARGAAGEIGVFQLMPATAAGLGVNPFDVAQNIRGGIAYLAQQLNRFGNVAQALAAYNWGPGSFAAVAGLADWFARIPASTQAYVQRILGSLGLATPAPASPATPATPSSSVSASPAVSVVPDTGPPADLVASFFGFAPADITAGTPAPATPGAVPALLLIGAAALVVLLLWSN